MKAEANEIMDTKMLFEKLCLIDKAMQIKIMTIDFHLPAIDTEDPASA